MCKTKPTPKSDETPICYTQFLFYWKVLETWQPACVPIMQGLHFLHVRHSSTCACRSLKHEKDQLQQRLDAQQEASVVPQASSAECELQAKGLQEQISQSEELLQVGTTSGCRDKHSLMRFLQVASTKAQDVLQCSNKGTATVSHGAGQACICYVLPV